MSVGRRNDDALPAFICPTLASICPGCHPEADLTGRYVVVERCSEHPIRDDLAGSEDGLATVRGDIWGSAEAGGDGNRRWCEWLHRDAR